MLKRPQHKSTAFTFEVNSNFSDTLRKDSNRKRRDFRKHTVHQMSAMQPTPQCKRNKKIFNYKISQKSRTTIKLMLRANIRGRIEEKAKTGKLFHLLLLLDCYKRFFDASHTLMVI
jgi:hypothetical protein